MTTPPNLDEILANIGNLESTLTPALNQGPIRITYQDGGGVVTERLISDIHLDGEKKIIAHCHLRDESRTFNLAGVKSAINQSTGEIIDIYVYVGVQPPQEQPPPVLVTAPPNFSPEDLLKFRKQEKTALWSRFSYPIVAKIYREKLVALFGSKCFLCGSPDNLHIDHHVPIKLGGRLLPGNLSVLCRRCNSLKSDFNPAIFYTEDELKRIAPLLESQKEIFNFKLDRDRWRKDKKNYLLDLGADELLVEEAFNNEMSRYYIGG